MKQEHRAHQRHHDELLDELALQGIDGAMDQVRAIVGRDDLHPVGETALEL